MDSSQYKMEEETEEFSSNESGWTKYIASPDPEHDFSSDHDDGDDDENGDIRCKIDHHGDDDGDGDDDNDHDSIASDASSGPAHNILPSEVGTIEGGYAKHEEDVDSCDFYSAGKKGYYKEVTERGGRVTGEKARNNEVIHNKPNRATSYGLKKQGMD
ncbi:hypothetical protein Dimus_014779 [Dionaea muscipula]